ncbi:unnamed protein product [Diamesa tonsa]
MTINLMNPASYQRLEASVQTFGIHLKSLQINNGSICPRDLHLLLTLVSNVENLILSDVKTKTNENIKRKKLEDFDLQKLKSLTVKRCSRKIEDIFLKIPIQSLKIFVSKTYNQSFTNRMVSLHPTLEELEIDIVGNFELSISSLNVLKHLTVKKEPYGLSPDIFMNFLKNQNQLTSLDISGIKINDHVFEEMTKNMRNLKVLKFIFDGLSGRQFKLLTDLKNLTDLKIEFSEIENEDFNKLCNIQCLKITNFSAVFYREMPLTDLTLMAQNNPQLECVSFYHCNKEIVKIFLNYCKNIKSFEAIILQDTETILIPDTSLVSASLRKFKVVHPISCHTDIMQLLITNCYNLTDLDICIFNGSINDDCFKSILIGMKHLKRFKLYYCDKLTDSILDLINEHGTKLEYIHLEGCQIEESKINSKFQKRLHPIKFNSKNYGG